MPTRAPSAASPMAVALPMPPVPPVTRTDFPAMRGTSAMVHSLAPKGVPECILLLSRACGLAGDDDVIYGLGFSHAGGGGAAADELAGGRPHGHVLVTGSVVVTDERHLLDADGKQVEPPWNRAPPQGAGHLLRVAALHSRFLLSARSAADLELPFTAVPAGDHAVHEHDARLQQAPPPERGEARLQALHPGLAALGRRRLLERGQARLQALHLRP